MTLVDYKGSMRGYDEYKAKSGVSEEAYEKFLAKKISGHDWKVSRQVWDDTGSKRIDLVLGDVTGYRVGIEVKVVKSVRCGSRFCEAWRQVREDYAKREFRRKKLDFVGCSFLLKRVPDEKTFHNFEESIRYFFSRSGIGFHVFAPPIQNTAKGTLWFDNGLKLLLWCDGSTSKTGRSNSFQDVVNYVEKRRKLYR